MDMDLCFADRTMRTTVYIKMDAPDQLLLSEGACRQLGIVSYHPSVTPHKASKKMTATVRTIRVNLVHSLRLAPRHGAVVPVELQEDTDGHDHVLIIQNQEQVERDWADGRRCSHSPPKLWHGPDCC